LTFYYWYKKEIRTVLTDIKFRFGIKSVGVIKCLIQNINIDKSDYNLITVVPSHTLRKFIRFFHPAKIIAKSLSLQSGIPYESLIKRIKNTDFQWKMSKKERHLNVKNIFVCKKNLSGLKILLVDDIVTTGSTLNECAKVLKKSGAVRVDALALTRGVYR
jgi:ComF family protein